MSAQSTPPYIGSDFSDSPFSVDEVVEYLDNEDFDRDHESLESYFTAQFPDRAYWVWKYRDFGGDTCLVVVSRRDSGTTEIGCGEFPPGVSTESEVAVFLRGHDF